MKQLRLFLYNIITMVVVMIMISACSESLGSQWVRTTEGTLSGVDSEGTLRPNNLICFMERLLLKI